MDARHIIARALYDFKESAETEKRGRPPWGIERSEWRADAVLKALSENGYTVTSQSRPDQNTKGQPND